MKIMKKSFICLAAIICTTNTFADNAVSLGYSHGKVSNGDNLRGANIKYSHSGEEWGILTAVNFMSGSKKNISGSYESDRFLSGERDTQYFSIMVGPTYKINQYLTAYGTLGLAHTSSDLNSIIVGESRTGTLSQSISTTSLAYALGLQAHVTEKFLIDFSYEGASSNNALNNERLNAFTVGVGYKF